MIWGANGYFFAPQWWAVRLSDSLAASRLGLVDDERVGPLLFVSAVARAVDVDQGSVILGRMQGENASVIAIAAAEPLRTKS